MHEHRVRPDLNTGVCNFMQRVEGRALLQEADSDDCGMIANDRGDCGENTIVSCLFTLYCTCSVTALDTRKPATAGSCASIHRMLCCQSCIIYRLSSSPFAPAVACRGFLYCCRQR